MPSAPPSGPKLMDYINPTPTRDVQEEDRLKKLAKYNAFGRMIGALGQLGGMAAGGDAVAIQDDVSPFVTNRLQYLDDDYRRRLEQFGQEAFRVGMHNNELENEYAREVRGQEFTDAQARIKAEEARQLAAQRAQDAMNQLLTKDKQAQEKEMRSLGVDPKDPKAKEKMLAAYKKKFDADIYSKYKTPGSGKDDKETDQEFIRIARLGRQAEIDRIQKMLDQENSKGLGLRNEELIKSLNAQMKSLRDVKLSKENQFALDLYDIGNASNTPQVDPNYMRGADWSYQPGQGIVPTTTEQEQRIFRSLQPILHGDDTTLPEVVEMLISTGVAKTEDEAVDMITDLLNHHQSNPDTTPFPLRVQ